MIPIILSALPVVAKLMDRVFGGKTGQVKKTVGSSIVEQIVAALGNQASNAAGFPLPAEIPGLLQGVVDKLNARGELKGENTLLDDAPACLLLCFAGGGVKVFDVTERK